MFISTILHGLKRISCRRCGTYILDCWNSFLLVFVLRIRTLLNTSCTKAAGEGKCVFGLVVSPDFSCCTRTPNVALASTVHLSRNCVPFMDFQRWIHHYLPNNPASHVSKSILPIFLTRRFQWLPGLGRGSTALRLLGLRVRAPPRHGRLSLLKVVCRQVEVSATDRSLVRMSLTEHGAFEFDLVTSTVRKPKASRDLKKNIPYSCMEQSLQLGPLYRFMMLQILTQLGQGDNIVS